MLMCCISVATANQKSILFQTCHHIVAVMQKEWNAILELLSQLSTNLPATKSRFVRPLKIASTFPYQTKMLIRNSKVVAVSGSL